MADNMQAPGLTIKWMERVCLHGLMAGNTKESIKMIRSMAMELSSGRMEGDTKATGKMVCNMETVSYTHLTLPTTPYV